MDTGETAAHTVECKQLRKGDGDEQEEHKSTEEEDDAKDGRNKHERS